MIPYHERRQRPRQQITMPVSIRCGRIFADSMSWYIGETKDVSDRGMQVKLTTPGPVPASSDISVLCFPKVDAGPAGVVDPVHLWMKGRVAWQNSGKDLLGIQFVP
jgi:hypothetical protein